MLNLNSKISELNGVGETRVKILGKLGLKSIHDLLFYFPFRYEDFTKNLTIANLETNSNANVIGTIELIQNKRSYRRKIYLTEALISDESDTIKVIWFNQAYLSKSLKVGDRISLAGRISEKNGQLMMISPQYERIISDKLIHTTGLIPNYHLTSNLSQKQIRSLVKQIIHLNAKISDWLPDNIKKELELLDLSEALQMIHFPKNKQEVTAARRRLSFAELFLRQLKSQILRRELKLCRATLIKFQKKTTKGFVDSLNFQLTTAQRTAAWEILQDLQKSVPMSRLLEGDVGSGKTIVAAMAILNTALNKKQTALMVPSEILAEQHFQSLTKLFKDYNIKILLLTRGHKIKTKDDLLKADLIIGTHALIQDKVKYRHLALVIVDEQHRFGVKQRQKLLSFKNQLTPHFLSMTATPIPRSLALTIYGDLDISIIDELPANRKKIITKLVTQSNRPAAYEFIRTQIKNGRQAFVVCPLIDASDSMGVKSVQEEYKKLEKEVFPELKVGLLHGRLKTKDKELIMNSFLKNEIQILVSTSVIEVGIDVPNASLMLIEGAERFGLASLHQFRGRVGRSHHQSYCLLFPSNEEISNPKTLERLEAMTKYNDGFSLAKIDLKLRGAGELYGFGQSGFPELQIAALFDYELIKKAQTAAETLIAADPEFKKHPLLKEKLGDWENSVRLE